MTKMWMGDDDIDEALDEAGDTRHSSLMPPGQEADRFVQRQRTELAASETGKSHRLYWILGGVAHVGAVYLMRRKS